ncbi:ARM repeat-containing protein [Coniochaeta hoffmannii]|uniref:ARM repeat-containing protein n=1 Tax=Coniochaeta hoffmannii TaxID=91930 RepID=A0AA38SLG8_9PEZI|nr:ARM repeat-containing protein [Coniochaeta hoffmannii]
MFTYDENSKHPEDTGLQTVQDMNASFSLKKSVSALTTSKLANQSNPKKIKTEHNPSAAYPMDKLLAKLTEQQAVLHQQNEALKSADGDAMFPRVLEKASSGSLPITPAADSIVAMTGSFTRPTSAASQSASDELLRLKLELAEAQNKISHLEAQTRLVKSDSGRNTPVGLPGSDLPSAGMDLPFDRLSMPMPSNGNGSRLPFARHTGWLGQDDSRATDLNDAFSAGGLTRTKSIWNTKPAFPNSFANVAPGPIGTGPQPVPWSNPRSSAQPFGDSAGPFAPPEIEPYRLDRLTPDSDMIRPSSSRRGNRFDNRFGPNAGFGSNFGSTMGGGAYDGAAAGYGTGGQSQSQSGMGSNMAMSLFPPYQLQSMSSPLSPYASEFTTTGGPWKAEPGAEVQTFLPSTEPLNYRRLLDRNVTCDWKYIVDKIVCNNDQQASIFLQQKLKVGTPEQKYDIVEAIVAQAYPLMVNRFGNFLVQRCFEHGTPEQVIKIAESIRGNTLNLSMDPFGCHVVQKAFDSVPEEYKAIMVHELLRRIPETVIHRYACHVWQKLFELRWSDTPPQIMKYVNDALKGMWHEVALGETGSLVVQNIFENCLEEDKRPCIEEVLQNIDIVAHGQFGNWCIQHICEHGAPADRGRAIDHVIRYASEYSMDQFASKVVEKCLKISGPEFLSRYLDRVCEGRMDRPRIPLIDIASDQYGNYLIQYILTHAGPQHREMVAAHIRKHMVSLRGSKFGSRVGMLCTNHAVATRPGPGVGPAMGGRMAPGPRYGGPSYR